MADPSTLVPSPDNANHHPEEQLGLYRIILAAQGWRRPIVVSRLSGTITRGHGALLAALSGGQALVPVEDQDYESPEMEKADRIADNRLASLSEIEDAKIAGILTVLQAAKFDVSFAGYTPPDFASLIASLQPQPEVGPGKVSAAALGSLRGKFGVPPFSVLDARAGYWQNRKREWLAIGIASELGRGDNLLKFSETVKLPAKVTAATSCSTDWMKRWPKQSASLKGGATFGISTHAYDAPDSTATPAQTGTSIFDPVLCELSYRWFCPPGGSILDPFAGGSVRGIVAGILGHPYIGIDLRAEQVEANRAQADALLKAIDKPTAPAAEAIEVLVEDPDALTPVQVVGEFWLKRDDLFAVGGVRGGKVRSCWHLSQGATGLVTAGSRQSPQVNIVAGIAAKLGIPCRVHTPTGELSPEVRAAEEKGAVVVQHKAGYNNVIIARAREDAEAQGWREIPFGMECAEAVKQTRRQAANLPPEVKRLVVPVGSGMSLAGILHGLADCGNAVPVLAVQVGSDPTKRLDEFAPAGWRDRVTLVKSAQDYHDEAPQTVLGGVQLDPIYEAKCGPFLQPGDCLWCVGIRQTAGQPPQPPGDAILPRWITADSRTLDRHVPPESADLVFSCPPYADLEVYSEDPADLSAVCDKDGYPAFLASYREIIAKAVSALRPNRFAVFVVGEVRAKTSGGRYLGFVPDTIRAFEDAGAAFYNEAILVTSVGSLPLRIGKQFGSFRKLGKTHQNVLVFFKGDPATVKGWPSVAFSFDNAPGEVAAR